MNNESIRSAQIDICDNFDFMGIFSNSWQFTRNQCGRNLAPTCFFFVFATTNSYSFTCSCNLGYVAHIKWYGHICSNQNFYTKLPSNGQFFTLPHKFISLSSETLARNRLKIYLIVVFLQKFGSLTNLNVVYECHYEMKRPSNMAIEFDISFVSACLYSCQI